MTGFERDLHNRLHTAPLPDAPPTLVRALDEIVRYPVPVRRRRGRPLALLALAAVLAGTGIIVASGAANLDPTDERPAPTAPAGLLAYPSETPTPTPAFPDEVDSSTATELHGRGLAHREAGDADLALADFTRAIELDSRYVEAFLDRARLHYYLRHNDPAIADYTRVIELDPTNAVAFALRGQVRATAGDTAAAADDFDRALALVTDPVMLDSIKHLRCSTGVACDGVPNPPSASAVPATMPPTGPVRLIVVQVVNRTTTPVYLGVVRYDTPDEVVGHATPAMVLPMETVEVYFTAPSVGDWVISANDSQMMGSADEADLSSAGSLAITWSDDGGSWETHP